MVIMINLEHYKNLFVNSLPNDTIKTAGKSFLCGFAVSYGQTYNLDAAILSGTIAATISLVYAVTKPIIERFTKEQNLNPLEQIGRLALSYMISSLVLRPFIPSHINLLSRFVTPTIYRFVFSENMNRPMQNPVEKALIFL